MTVKVSGEDAALIKINYYNYIGSYLYYSFTKDNCCNVVCGLSLYPRTRGKKGIWKQIDRQFSNVQQN